MCVCVCVCLCVSVCVCVCLYVCSLFLYIDPSKCLSTILLNFDDKENCSLSSWTTYNCCAIGLCNIILTEFYYISDFLNFAL